MLHRSLFLPSFALCPHWDPYLYWQPRPSVGRYWKPSFADKNSTGPAFPAVVHRCSLMVRMQQLLLKVICSTLLLLAVVPSVRSQPGRAESFYYPMTVWVFECILCLLSLIPSLLSTQQKMSVVLYFWQKVRVWDATWQWNYPIWLEGLQ